MSRANVYSPILQVLAHNQFYRCSERVRQTTDFSHFPRSRHPAGRSSPQSSRQMVSEVRRCPPSLPAFSVATPAGPTWLPLIPSLQRRNNSALSVRRARTKPFPITSRKRSKAVLRAVGFWLAVVMLSAPVCGAGGRATPAAGSTAVRGRSRGTPCASARCMTRPARACGRCRPAPRPPRRRPRPRAG